MRNWLYGCIVAFQFLTKIPVPLKVPYQVETVSRSLPFYPLVGIIIGAIAYAAASLLPAGMAPLNALLLLLLWTFLSGGLHFDGWMDTADAFGSYRDREKMLEIMKDSRVGAMGVIYAVFLLLLKWISLWTVMEHWAVNPDFNRMVMYLLLSIPAVSRWWMVAAVIQGPYIGGPSGLGRQFAEVRNVWLAGASIWLLLILFLLPSSVWLAVFVGQLIAGWLFGRYIKGKLKGWTGDTYGALNEAVEAVGFIISAYTAVLGG
ncbi:adenosylcobinamide-GDP ribazoletransferase [Ferviditalea candida]|uniref:Adenosylcobinamide-GDP ribazoletransferase n=1 Tax=Ferviditalea candida TaxID=3108399 RepID=A0ABU5ZHV9_9BACL|nr:adenosylcobinamide-GDP ribazoletransferase [Paenibacillaceae bacterium T2]